GASNVAVENPPWLAGGHEVLHGLVIPYSRVAVVLFVVLAALLVWFLLHRTRLGLTLRAVTQNRSMAACMGVRTGRVDMWTFGLGSGIAGLGGVALSQLGNVGPELGQSYILESFMVGGPAHAGQRRSLARQVLHLRLLHGGGAGWGGAHRRDHRRGPGAGHRPE